MTKKIIKVKINQDVSAGELVTEEKIETQIIDEHRVFFYYCRQCKKKRQSYKMTIAHAGVCRSCRKIKINKNQLSLMDLIFGRGKKR